jgi:hypothetical protein
VITAEHFKRSSKAILAVTEPADRYGVTICLDTGAKALLAGDHETAGAMLDEAAARAGIIDAGKLAELHLGRLAGTR